MTKVDCGAAPVIPAKIDASDPAVFGNIRARLTQDATWLADELTRRSHRIDGSRRVPVTEEMFLDWLSFLEALCAEIERLRGQP